MATKPRIALLFEYPTLNGGERSILSSVEPLGARFEFAAFAPSGGLLVDALSQVGVEVFPSPLAGAGGQRASRTEALDALAEAVRASRADLLHGNSLAMGRLTGAVAARVNAACTTHLRDIIGLSAAAVVDLNGNARLVAVSNATRAFHVGQGIDVEKVVTVNNGVDVDRFRPRARDGRVREELGVPEEAFVALTVGQVGLRKGWNVLAQAAELLAARFPSLHVVLAGERYSDKPETVEYERSVREGFAAAMPVRAHFVGYHDDMSALMNAADLLVHPARQEPFGRVLLEAAASGLPMVATDVGGTAELLTDGVSARLLPPGDAGALAAAVEELLSDAGLRSRFAATARRRVETEFSAERAAERLAAVWEGVLAESDRR